MSVCLLVWVVVALRVSLGFDVGVCCVIWFRVGGWALGSFVFVGFV